MDLNMSLFTRIVGPDASLPLETIVGLMHQVAEGRITEAEATARLQIPAAEKTEVSTLVSKITVAVDRRRAVNHIRDYLYLAELQHQGRLDVRVDDHDFLDETAFWTMVDEETGII